MTAALDHAPLELTATPHAQRVARIQSRLKELRGQKIHVDKGGVHHFVPLPGDQRFQGRAVDISDLKNILAIDKDAKTATVEPGVTFEELVPATLAYGLLPALVPELEGITVGGAIAGSSVESMSHRYGGLHDTALEYELVTTDGERILCSPEKDADLFHMIHGSYGTLAILASAKIRLVPAKRFVKMEYRTLPTAAAFVKAMDELVKADAFPFIDAIVHGPDRFTLCLGTFVDEAPYVSSYKGTEIFYKSTRTKKEDYLRTEEYCFRYDTECHWLTKTVPPLEWKPVRALVGRWFLGSTNLIRWSKRLAPILALQKRPDVVVDVFIPSLRLGEFLDWYVREYAFYPLWIVPYRVPAPYPWIAKEHAAKFGSDLFIDCAVYGKKNRGRDDASEVLEKKTYELGGIKTLISRNHHSRAQFWTIYDKPAYDAAKTRLDPAGVFPNLYDKFHR